MFDRTVSTLLLTIILVGAAVSQPYEPHEPCDMPPLPLQPRIENRTSPSLFYAWGNRDQWAPYDLVLCCPRFNLEIVKTDGAYQYQSAEKPRVRVNDEPLFPIEIRDRYLADNPNKIFLTAISVAWNDLDEYPSDSPFWLRDDNGEIQVKWGLGLMDIHSPAWQAEIFLLAKAIDRCGLYDGIFIDGWGSDDDPGQIAILKGIRERVRDDLPIIVNTNRSKPIESAPFINGLQMETVFPSGETDPGDIERKLSQIEDTLRWAEESLRTPTLNTLEATSDAGEPADSPRNMQWMRALTTLSLTFSDGYFVYKSGESHRIHLWYDFWDADLGRPLGPKSQNYENIEGLYIREYTNGWAVYNHSGEARIVTLPEEVRSVATGLSNVEHVLLNYDGGIYIRSDPAVLGDVNGDKVVNIFDLILVAQSIGTAENDANGDGVTNIFDLVFVAEAIQNQ